MRIAVLSDIHANLEALEAALADLEDREAETVLVAGDLVGDGPDPAGVVKLLRTRTFATIRGNVDNKVVATAALPEAQQAVLLEKKKRADLVRTARQLGRTNLRWLERLPTALTQRFEGKVLQLVHGSPLGDTDYIFPSLTSRALAAKLGSNQPDVLVCGHSHIPFARRIRGVTVVNAGSVGRPVDGDPRGSYALVEIERDQPPRARIVRFSYPFERSRARIIPRQG
jgi:putative phosphoesterase